MKRSLMIALIGGLLLTAGRLQAQTAPTSAPAPEARASRDMAFFRPLLQLSAGQDSAMRQTLRQFYEGMQLLAGMREAAQRKEQLASLVQRRDAAVKQQISSEQYGRYQRHLDSMARVAASRYQQ